jgi:hypothetical protein
VQYNKIRVDFVCNTTSLDVDPLPSNKNDGVFVKWTVHRDNLFGQNGASYLAKLCNNYHCIEHSTTLTVKGKYEEKRGTDAELNHLESHFKCPSKREETISIEDWKQLKKLNGKSAVIFGAVDNLWATVGVQQKS